uniref:AlNc14C418G11501 protein n=1 Tax=Albugo laibachii Nc14 TaxID=890382 RepID=F0WZ94_9STRA|nr:AlNc14C418G11501 [Albugo laibachii Nc14]CCA26860.1 AlNc14C423G11542 [Albugo laibachii Nc14]|eukprot:CCA26860.1 AlNc14C423G11542 [Albugo laibachii Nc14]
MSGCMGESHIQANSYAGQKYNLDASSNVTVWNPEGKTKRTASSLELEEYLLLWIRQGKEHKLPFITGATIWAKAAKICRELVRSGNCQDTVKRW